MGIGPERQGAQPIDANSNLWLLALAGIWAGAQNALAGGGSFVTLPALMLAGLDARTANLTSTVALFPGQVTTALTNRKLVAPLPGASLALLFGFALAGGALGAILLLLTPSEVFRAMLPWLVLVATGLFARGAFGRRPEAAPMKPGVLRTGHFLVSVYGGYFGGGGSFVLLALFSLAGATVRHAQANKNALLATMNLSSTAVFIASGAVVWGHALVLGLGSMVGGYAGARAINMMPERLLKGLVVAIGVILTIALFWRG